MATATTAHTARKPQWCDDHDNWHGARVIRPGHRYLRHVAFPGDDANGGKTPWVLKQCIACANRYDDTRGTVVGGACSTLCCGWGEEMPCALPLGHEGDHSCVRCAFADKPALVAT